MKSYIKGSLKVLSNYSLTVLIFLVFLSMFLGLPSEKFVVFLPIYSAFIFLIMTFIVYTELKSIALKEMRPAYNLNPFPLKGLIYGLIGFSPYILTVVILPLITLEGELQNRIKHLALNCLLGPLYFILKIGHESAISYYVVCLVVPLVAMLGYMAGYYGIELIKYKRKVPKPKK